MSLLPRLFSSHSQEILVWICPTSPTSLLGIHFFPTLTNSSFISSQSHHSYTLPYTPQWLHSGGHGQTSGHVDQPYNIFYFMLYRDISLRSLAKLAWFPQYEPSFPLSPTLSMQVIASTWKTSWLKLICLESTTSILNTMCNKFKLHNFPNSSNAHKTSRSTSSCTWK